MDFREFDFQPFRDNLSKLINASGVTIPVFAEKIGTSPSTINRYLTMQRTPDLRSIVLIADACNVSTDWLLGLNSNSSSVTPDTEEFVGLYEKASDNDKRIVNSILSKYKE